jgi:hypothetical protein
LPLKIYTLKHGRLGSIGFLLLEKLNNGWENENENIINMGAI